MEAEKILIAEADSRTAELASIKLSNAGYVMFTASEGKQALEKAEANLPSLFLVGLGLPDMDGMEVCYRIKSNPMFEAVPVILMADAGFDRSVLEAGRVRVDDVLTKPFAPKVLLAKVNEHLVNYRLLKQINPLTMLPGKIHLKNKVNTLIDCGEHFEVVFVDLKEFGVYNKIYGFEAGDRIILYMVNILKRMIAEGGVPGLELFHLGGDDFAILSKEIIPEIFYHELIELFRQGIGEYYTEEDRLRGGIVYTNRRGMLEQSPLMTIDLGVVGNFKRHFGDWLEVEAVGEELLKYAKTLPGCHWVKDRRAG